MKPITPLPEEKANELFMKFGTLAKEYAKDYLFVGIMIIASPEGIADAMIGFPNGPNDIDFKVRILRKVIKMAKNPANYVAEMSFEKPN